MQTIRTLRVRRRTWSSIKIAVIGFVAIAASLQWQARLGPAERLKEVDWVSHAKVASTELPRNKAALYWLKAASVQPSPDTFLQLRRVWSGSLPTPSPRLHMETGEAFLFQSGRSASCFSL